MYIHYACLIKVGPNRAAALPFRTEPDPVCLFCLCDHNCELLACGGEGGGNADWTCGHAQAFKLPFAVANKIPQENDCSVYRFSPQQ